MNNYGNSRSISTAAIIFIGIMSIAGISMLLEGVLFFVACFVVCCIVISLIFFLDYLNRNRTNQPNEDQNRINDKELSDGIESYLSDSSYRYEIQEDDELRWHKRELNFIFEEASSTSRLKRELVRNIAHEIRTPLTSLQLVAEGLEDGIFTVDDGTSMRQIVESVNRMNTTVKMMSDYVTDGIEGIEGETSDLAKCLIAAYEKACATAEQRGVEVSIRKSDFFSSSPALVKMPSSSLNAVLSSIVTNAFEHAYGMKKLTISLEDEIHPLSKKLMAKVSITDDGCGAPSEMAYKMCEPFWKADESHKLDKEKTSSPGLGLSVVKELVSQTGGRFDIRCSEGMGTCVSIWLPMSA